MTGPASRLDGRRSFARSSALWVTAGSLGSAALTVIGFRVLGELAGPAALAEGVLTYGMLLLATSLLAIPISQGIGRYFFDVHTPTEQGGLYYSAVALSAVAFGIVSLVFIGAAAASLVPLGHYWLVLPLALELLRPICVSWLSSRRDFLIVGVSQILDAGLRPVVASLLHRYGVEGVELVLLSYTIAAFISVGGLVATTSTLLPVRRPQRVYVAQLVTYGAPLISTGLFYWVASSGDRYLVAFVLGAKPAGIYLAASALGGRLALTLGGIWETYYRPALYEAIAARDRVALKRSTVEWLRRIVVSGALTFVAIAVCLPWITAFLLAPELRPGAEHVILISFVAYWIVAIAFIPVRINYGFERTGFVALGEVLGMVVMSAAVYLLGSHYGLAGAAGGLVVAAVAKLTFVIALARYAISRGAWG